MRTRDARRSRTQIQPATNGAKFASKSTKSQPVVSRMAKGCYLTFSDASQGTLFLHWCVTVQIYFCRAAAHLSRVVGRRLVVYNAHRSEAPVAGALAFFEPRKTVPAFKYKSNGGRSELIREMSGGTGERIKRFYQRANRFTAPSIRHRRDVCSMAHTQAFTRASANTSSSPSPSTRPWFFTSTARYQASRSPSSTARRATTTSST